MSEPIAVDARGVVERLFPGALSLRQWRAMDAAGKVPRGFRVGGRKVWRVADLERWAALAFPDRAEFEARMPAKLIEGDAVRLVERWAGA